MNSVAIVGVGNMGGAMAARLLEQGWAVRVFDIDPAKVEALERLGATACANPADASKGCGALIVCVVDAAQIEEVLFGLNGAAAAMRAPQAVLLCPTIAPSDTANFARRLAESGIDAVDAP